MNPSRLRPGSGLGLGFGAFFASFLPLSLLPMDASVPQMGGGGKAKSLIFIVFAGSELQSVGQFVMI
jgi:hypothetical protein